MEWGCGQMKPIDGDEKKEGKDFLVVQLAKTSTLPMQGAGVRSRMPRGVAKKKKSGEWSGAKDSGSLFRPKLGSIWVKL